MQKFIESVRRFLADESGPTSIEYLFMLALVITAAVGGIRILGNFTNDLLIKSREMFP